MYELHTQCTWPILLRLFATLNVCRESLFSDFFFFKAQQREEYNEVIGLDSLRYICLRKLTAGIKLNLQ